MLSGATKSLKLTEALIMAAEGTGPLLHARVGMLRAINAGKPIAATIPRRKRTRHTAVFDGSILCTIDGGSNMKAARIHRFGAPDVVVVEDVPRPAPAAGELLIRVAASGVGPWDALIRAGKSKVSPPPPLTLGSDLSGVVEEVGPGVSEFKKGDEIYGVTNHQFCGANAQYAVAHANMVALRPSRLSHVESASAPVIAVTAWQMLFEYGNAKPNQTVMILGAAGNVGAYAVQLAVNAGLQVIGVVGSKDIEYAKALGSQKVVNYQAGESEFCR